MEHRRIVMFLRGFWKTNSTPSVLSVFTMQEENFFQMSLIESVYRSHSVKDFLIGTRNMYFLIFQNLTKSIRERPLLVLTMYRIS